MKVALSFQTISQAIRQLSLPPFDLVVGIGRGGVVPASLIAHTFGLDLAVVQFNYRDDANQPRHAVPQLLHAEALPGGVRSVLLVDDVSVTGKTLEAARALLGGYAVTTLVLKGHADYVLFPEISTCVHWPWQPRQPAVQK